jgi:hypothetical protein
MLVRKPFSGGIEEPAFVDEEAKAELNARKKEEDVQEKVMVVAGKPVGEKEASNDETGKRKGPPVGTKCGADGWGGLGGTSGGGCPVWWFVEGVGFSESQLQASPVARIVVVLAAALPWSVRA